MATGDRDRSSSTPSPSCLNTYLLFTPTVTVERALQLIKGGYSHRFGSEFGRNKEVWERGFTDHRIRDAQDFETHREYIHQNPVERNIVENE
jgi:putative transposase